MRIELAGGPVKRLVSVWRDFDPLPGEKVPRRIAVDSYDLGYRGYTAKTVADLVVVDTPRWQQFLIDDTPEGDRLLAALKGGPIRPAFYGNAWVIDLDRVEPARAP